MKQSSTVAIITGIVACMTFGIAVANNKPKPPPVAIQHPAVGRVLIWTDMDQNRHGVSIEHGGDDDCVHVARIVSLSLPGGGRNQLPMIGMKYHEKMWCAYMYEPGYKIIECTEDECHISGGN